jgi:hypothetical protein
MAATTPVRAAGLRREASDVRNVRNARDVDDVRDLDDVSMAAALRRSRGVSPARGPHYALWPPKTHHHE